MKIAVCGTQCIGKTTFINDFLATWPMYKLCTKEKYTTFVGSNNLKLNEQGNEESQQFILNNLTDQVMYEPKDSFTIFDRSVLDNLVYTMWLNSQSRVSDKFVSDTIKIVKETLSFYDILFYLPITKASPVPLVPKGDRSIDPVYREEIDNIFKSLVKRYNQNDNFFFPFDSKLGCPAIIEIFGNQRERIELAKMYITTDGKCFGEDQSLLSQDKTSEDKPHIIEF